MDDMNFAVAKGLVCDEIVKLVHKQEKNEYIEHLRNIAQQIHIKVQLIKEKYVCKECKGESDDKFFIGECDICDEIMCGNCLCYDGADGLVKCFKISCHDD